MAILTPVRGLRSFCEAAKTLSFKATSEALYVTPSAVSHQLKQLEQQLGFQLFKRLPRSLELTDRGNQLFLEIQPILSQLEATVDKFMLTEEQASVHLALPEFFANELFIPNLSRWSERYPGVNLSLETFKTHEKTEINADLSVIRSAAKPSYNLVYELFPLRYTPACNENIFNSNKNTLSILSDYPLILHKAHPTAWHQWAEENQIQNFKPKQIIQLDTMLSVAKATEQGIGISLIPLPIGKKWFEQELLFKLFDATLVAKDKYYLIQHETHKNRGEVSACVEWIRTELVC